jgi:hypothetical protein
MSLAAANSTICSRPDVGQRGGDGGVGYDQRSAIWLMVAPGRASTRNWLLDLLQAIDAPGARAVAVVFGRTRYRWCSGFEQPGMRHAYDDAASAVATGSDVRPGSCSSML